MNKIINTTEELREAFKSFLIRNLREDLKPKFLEEFIENMAVDLEEEEHNEISIMSFDSASGNEETFRFNRVDVIDYQKDTFTVNLDIRK